jgi:hypothetical protein
MKTHKFFKNVSANIFIMAHVGSRPSTSQGTPELPELRERGMYQMVPRSLQKGPTLPTPPSWIFGCRNCEGTNFYCSSPKLVVHSNPRTLILTSTIHEIKKGKFLVNVRETP